MDAKLAVKKSVQLMRELWLATHPLTFAKEIADKDLAELSEGLHRVDNALSKMLH
jgi:hypothetical protein